MTRMAVPSPRTAERPKLVLIGDRHGGRRGYSPAYYSSLRTKQRKCLFTLNALTFGFVGGLTPVSDRVRVLKLRKMRQYVREMIRYRDVGEERPP